jgi:hypothetical protein
MDTKEFISIIQLCENYHVEKAFFNQLHEVGLIHIITIEKIVYVHQDSIAAIEKMIRFNQELNINIEGIDVIFNLLQKMNSLQEELNTTQNRLRLYETDF